MPMRKQYIIDPVSTPANGEFSFASGNSNLAFNIQESDSEFLIGGSVKLSFKFKILDAADAIETTAEKVGVSPQCGLHGLFSQVDFHSYSTNVSISSIKNYPRMVSSLLSVGLADYYDTQNGQQQAGVSYGREYNSSNVGIYLSVSPETEQSYTIKPYMGALEESWYLGNTLRNGIGGGKLNFTLASNGMALTNYDIATATDYEYVISDVKLQYETYVASEEEQMAGRLKNDWVESYTDMVRESENRSPSAEEIQRNWEATASQSMNNPAPVTWRDYNSYLTTIQSDNANVSLNLGLSRVHSIFSNFVKSSTLNNLATDGADSNKTYLMEDNAGDMIPFDTLTMTKGNQLFPANYTLSTNVKDNNYVGTADDNSNDRCAEIVKYYLDSVIPYVDNKYNQASSENSLSNTQYRQRVKEDDMGGKGSGIGTGQLSTLDGTSNFQFSPLGLQINTDNTGTFVNHSAFIYALADRTLSWSGGQIAVVS